MRTKSNGFTLIEFAVVIALLGILASTEMFYLIGNEEDRDAALIGSAQATIQQLVSQGSVRMDRLPTDAQVTSRVLLAAQESLQQNSDVTVTGGGLNYTVSIGSTSRSATYQIQNDGKVRITSLGGNFNNHGVNDGKIYKQ